MADLKSRNIMGKQTLPNKDTHGTEAQKEREPTRLLTTKIEPKNVTP